MLKWKIQLLMRKSIYFWKGKVKETLGLCT